MCEPKVPMYLLNIDMDKSYAHSLPPELVAAFNSFTRAIRPHVQIIHVWHAINFNVYPENRWLYREGKNIASFEPDQHKEQIPLIDATDEDFILAKNRQSAFLENSLIKHIDKNGIVLVAGTRGDVCVDQTLTGGRNAGFNMVAVRDLIHRPLMDYMFTEEICSDDILDALDIPHPLSDVA
jgi:nicotinamidase-related amidase